MQHGVRLYHACGVFLIGFFCGRLSSGHKALASPSTSEFRQKNPFYAEGLKAGLLECKSSGQQCCLRSSDASCANDAWTPHSAAYRQSTC